MRPFHFALAFVVLNGCSAVTNTGPLPPSGGRPAVDAGGGVSDAGGSMPDTGTVVLDAGMDRIDAGGAGCGTAAPVCTGEVLVSCVEGARRRQDCAAAAAFCVDDPPHCEPRVCVPGTMECDASLTTLLTCDDRGSAVFDTTCPFGCDPAGPICRDAPPACTGIPTLPPGDHRFSTCGQGDDSAQQPWGDCPGAPAANGEDVIMQFTLTGETDVVLDLRDDDDSTAIDTVLYIRRVCDDGGSQVACDDDVPCTMSDVYSGCVRGVQVRQSRIAQRLPAGTYYVIADSFDYESRAGRFTCGHVLLRFRMGGGFPVPAG